MQRQTMQMQRQGRLPLNYNEGMNPDGSCDKCGEVHEGSCEPESKEKKDAPDSRGSYAMMNLIKNKLRARGLKMSYEPQGKMTEATEDSLRDRRMERGGVDGNVDYRRPPKNTNNDFGKKKSSGMSALEKVKADIRAKHGKGAIMDTKKK